MTDPKPAPAADSTPDTAARTGTPPAPETPRKTEIGGRKGPEPTRYGDWERNGIISDF